MKRTMERWTTIKKVCWDKNSKLLHTNGLSSFDNLQSIESTFATWLCVSMDCCNLLNQCFISYCIDKITQNRNLFFYFKINFKNFTTFACLLLAHSLSLPILCFLHSAQYVCIVYKQNAEQDVLPVFCFLIIVVTLLLFLLSRWMCLFSYSTLWLY